MSIVCPCPDPPGGQIICSDDQLAICGYRDGRIVSGCFDKPRDTDLLRWALLMITGTQRNVVTANEIRLLHAGRYESPGGVLAFILPRTFASDLLLFGLRQGNVDRASISTIVKAITKDRVVPGEGEFSGVVGFMSSKDPDRPQ